MQLHSIRKNKYTSNLDKNACLRIRELEIKRIFREKEEKNTGQGYRNKTEGSTTNGSNHYPYTIQYTGKARTQYSSKQIYNLS